MVGDVVAHALDDGQAHNLVGVVSLLRGRDDLVSRQNKAVPAHVPELNRQGARDVHPHVGVVGGSSGGDVEDLGSLALFVVHAGSVFDGIDGKGADGGLGAFMERGCFA